MAGYNGHRSWAYWNVSLWIGNDEGLYNLARECVRRTHNRTQAAQAMLEALTEAATHCRCGEESASGSFRGHAHRWGPTSHHFTPATPDGAAYSVDKIRSAMRGF